MPEAAVVPRKIASPKAFERKCRFVINNFSERAPRSHYERAHRRPRRTSALTRLVRYGSLFLICFSRSARQITCASLMEQSALGLGCRFHSLVLSYILRNFVIWT